jgi:uncharacterized protein
MLSSDIEVIYDPAKNQRNIRERGLSLNRSAEFDFETAAYLTDARREYGEVRRIAVGKCTRGKEIWQSENH